MPEITITKLMATVLDVELQKCGVVLPRVRCEEIIERIIDTTAELASANIKAIITSQE